MSTPDIQYFASSGTWVKPPLAVAVDAVTCGGGAGASGLQDGEDGELRVQRFRADELPDELQIEIGKGGRPGGRDGYALIVTHLAEEAAPHVPGQFYTRGSSGTGPRDPICSACGLPMSRHGAEEAAR